MKKRFSRKRGFALVELLVVVAVIALLMSILLPSLPAVKDRDKIAQCLANMRSLMQSTNIYLLDHDDNFPMYPKSAGGVTGICGWSYGGKTNDSYWKSMPYFYHEFDQRPMNGWILTYDPEPDPTDPNGIIKRTEVPILRCPADKTSYQRLWGTPGAQPYPMSCYDDVGTSYLYNFAVYLGPNIDVIKKGMSLGQTVSWLSFQGGWAIINRDLIRDVRLSCPAEFVLFYEDPMDWGLGNYPKRRVMGNHGQFSKHTAGFLDGHASFEWRDTRSFCGPSWFALNPSWIPYPSQPTGPYYYSNYNIRNCNPLEAIGPGDTGQ